MLCRLQAGYGELSEYELKRLETIKENKAFLSSINMDQVSLSLSSSMMMVAVE